MNVAVFQTLKKRACFARFPTLSTCRSEDKKIGQFARLIDADFLDYKRVDSSLRLSYIVQWKGTI
jgi:hypothetical protein